MRGDFSVALVADGTLQVVLVDVSGHGPDVAARASQLCGAFGGLIGAVPAESLLPACNAYVWRQRWQHTYATAIHLCVDTTTGRAQVRSAGHPAAQVRRASGGWEPAQATGPLLGLVEQPSFVAVELALQPRDTLMLLSDGLLDPGSDEPYPQLLAGVSRWAAGASREVEHRLIADVPVQVEDDQSIVLVRRDGVGQDGAYGT
jgi:serine phosphatase RsbU (regulator of sigma subunit)